MTLLQALLLGLLQGLTEFLPISSSTHLYFAKWLMGLPQGKEGVLFDLVCHGGTLFALLFYLRKEIWSVLRNPKEIALFALALLPLVPAYFLFAPLRADLAATPDRVAYGLWITALFLFIASRKSLALCPAEGTVSQKPLDALWIGAMQAAALIPGISRSGSTIAMARLLGWSWRSGAKFSFLLSIPAILGGEVLELSRFLAPAARGEMALPWPCYAVGCLASLGAGLLVVRLILWAYEKQGARLFAWYCLGAGILVWGIFHGKTVV